MIATDAASLLIPRHNGWTEEEERERERMGGRDVGREGGREREGEREKERERNHLPAARSNGFHAPLITLEIKP